MITISTLLSAIITEEDNKTSSEIIGHLPHPVELSLVGQHETTLRHLENAFNVIQGKPSEGTLSDKIDGKVSILFGKKNGRSFVKYKGEGAKELYSEEDIENHIKETGKDYLRDSFLAGLKAASHHSIGDNLTYHADTLIDDGEHFKGNITRYKKPDPKFKFALAVHTVYDSNTGKRLESAPNLSHLEADTGMHFPNLSLKDKKFDITPEEVSQIRSHLDAAKKHFGGRATSSAIEGIATHRDETLSSKSANTFGHRSRFFKMFNNAFQRSEIPMRSVGAFVDFAKGRIERAKGLADKTRIKTHLSWIQKNKQGVSRLFRAHDHADAARDMIVDVLHRSGSQMAPIDPKTGEVNHTLGEGQVSVIPDTPDVKLVKRGFSTQNAAESAARKVKVEEEMSVGAGGIAGIGGPEDVAVPVAAQRKYTKKNKIRKRKILESFFTKYMGG